MKLYPQFHPVDKDKSLGSDWQRLTSLIRLPLLTLEAQRKSHFSEDMFEFSKIGVQITDKEIEDIYTELLAVAKNLGYPNSREKKINSDSPWAEILHKRMGVTRNEASKAGIWNALSWHGDGKIRTSRQKHPLDTGSRKKNANVMLSRDYGGVQSS
jgi:hypothetical protein